MKSYNVLHLILAFCGGLLLGFITGGLAGKSAASEQAQFEAQQVAAADTTHPHTQLTEPTSKPADKAATKPSKKVAKKPAEKAAAKPEDKNPKPAKPTGEITSAPKTASAPKGAPAFSLINDGKAAFYYSLNTYASGIEDISVNMDDLKPWGATAKDYAGTYNAGSESDISRIRVVPLGTGRVNLVMSFSITEYSNEGLAVDKTGDETAKAVAISNSVCTWRKTGRVYITRGQFVSWTQDGKTAVGLLVQGEHPTRPYVLLRKATR